MQTRVQKLLRRRGKRGAALVEAVVVIPFFIIIFASILFVGNLYKEKMRVMRLTKESAWAYAMENCGNAGDGMTTTGIPRSEDAPGGGPGASEPADTGDANLGDSEKAGGDMAGLASKDYGSSQAQMKSSVTADGYIGGLTKDVTSHTRVMCNEAPYNGDLIGFLKAGWQAISTW
jgi:hypothetical protein